MSKEPLNWNKMLRLLGEFRKKFGHCKVPAQWKSNPQLGRWVTALRYRQKMKDLPADRFRQLDALGFVWAANDAAWNRQFKKLEAFKKRYGHSNVPSLWKGNPLLAAWVSNQRTQHRQGKLTTERIKRLEELGFEWAIYGPNRAAKRRPMQIPPKPKPDAERAGEERMYNLGNDLYIQYDGVSSMLPELARYAARHRGELPSYIPLPKKRTLFFLPHPAGRGLRKIGWPGTGKLPSEVVDFLRENGALPAYE
jgi:hypothetical protein